MATTWEYGDFCVIKEEEWDSVNYTLCDFSSGKESEACSLDRESPEDAEVITQLDNMLEDNVNPYEIFKEYLAY